MSKLQSFFAIAFRIRISNALMSPLRLLGVIFLINAIDHHFKGSYLLIIQTIIFCFVTIYIGQKNNFSNFVTIDIEQKTIFQALSLLISIKKQFFQALSLLILSKKTIFQALSLLISIKKTIFQALSLLISIKKPIFQALSLLILGKKQISAVNIHLTPTQMKNKKHAVIYLLPRKGYFKAAFVFAQKASNLIMAGDITKVIKEDLANAKKYAEVRGLIIAVSNSNPLSDIEKLINFKIAN